MLNCKVAFKLVIELVAPPVQKVSQIESILFLISPVTIRFKLQFHFFQYRGNTRQIPKKAPLTNTKVIKQFKSMQLSIMIYSGK